ncbi:hypothetical protein GF314_03770 [bacterium]|nr:hypothetical protein [bacterium]
MRLVIVPLILALLVGCASRPLAPLVPVEGAPPDSMVAATLERAVTMGEILHSYRWAQSMWTENLELIDELQPTLVGRAALVWGWEHLMLRSLGALRFRVAAVHELAPDAVVQGCIFEFVSRDVERVKVPEEVLAAFGQPVEHRAFDFDAMLPATAEPDWFPGWEREAAVPDITRTETQLWFYHLATLYLDAGIEAIHLGNLERMAAHDPGLRRTEVLLRRIREYAAANARRGWVMLDAHTHGVVLDGRLLLDFHSFPLRPREVGDPAREDVVLEAGFLDAIYGRSRGGVTPSGTHVESQRYLVELDNGYAGPSAGGCELPECVWGCDEITWFWRQSPDRRDELLAYFWHRVQELDPVGRLQVPGVRTLQAQLSRGCERYLMHDPGAVGCGAGQVSAVLELWSGR